VNMTNHADGTDGKGTMKLGGNRISGKSTGDFGHTKSRAMPNKGPISGKVDASYGTKAPKNVGKTHFPTDSNKDNGPISKTGGRL